MSGHHHVFIVLAPFLQLSVSAGFENLRNVWLVAFVILFQPEIRRLLIYVGKNQLVRYFVQVSDTRVIDEVVKATLELRDRGYGALIVVGRETGLKQWLETGVRLQAEVSTPLLLSIFNPRSPLHDGAIIIQNDIIEAAKCTSYRLNDDIKSESEYGTRHRAADWSIRRERCDGHCGF